MGGTGGYDAPEKNANYIGKPSDIWSLGVILFILLFKRMPLIKDGVLVLPANIPNQELELLLVNMLETSYRKRFDINQIIGILQRLQRLQ